MWFERLQQWLNTFLIANLFLVVFGFGWFVLSVSGAFIGIPLGYRVWSQLWYPLFQPALGILMAGALISGIWSWVAKRLHRD